MPKNTKFYPNRSYPRRKGTSVDAKLINNIFYHCEEAAIKMPTKANEAEGNCYVKEEGGYLRILYPQPPVCLHLPAWQEFYGFDLQIKLRQKNHLNKIQVTGIVDAVSELNTMHGFNENNVNVNSGIRGLIRNCR